MRSFFSALGAAGASDVARTRIFVGGSSSGGLRQRRAASDERVGRGAARRAPSQKERGADGRLPAQNGAKGASWSGVVTCGGEKMQHKIQRGVKWAHNGGGRRGCLGEGSLSEGATSLR